jgi:AcrR family transcriptional regulator
MATVNMRRQGLRAEQALRTRRRIADAALRVFSDRGYGAARIEDIAAEAGVAVPTVYKVFGNKPALLAAAMNSALTGGDPDASVEEQMWWVEQIEQSDPVQELRLIARNARRINERAGAIMEVTRAAAALDRGIAEVWAEVNAERMARSRRTARHLAAIAGARLRYSLAGTAHTLWALTMPELFTQHRGARYSAARYERWLAGILVTSLLTDE